MITVNNLVKRHGNFEVLKGVSMTVAPGEVAAIIGPSGGGKSTFLRCINGLERFQGGAVSVGGLVLTRATTASTHAALLCELRRRVGMVFQQLNLFPHLTVLENLTEAPVHVLGENRDEVVPRAEALLARIGLTARKDAYPKALSGGQQQRVAIARALMMKPEAILFDEPTSALDPVMSAEVLSVITDLARGGQTMLVVTHSMAFARKVATNVHVFAEGRDVEHGPPDALFDDPQHAVTKAFLSEVTRA